MAPMDCGDCAISKLVPELSDVLCTHKIIEPKTGMQYPMHGALMRQSSSYFDALIRNSHDWVLRLPWDQLGFFESGIPAMVDCIHDCDCARISLTDGNCLDLYMTADFFLLSQMGAMALEFIKGRCSASVDFALAVWSCTDEFFLPELSKVAFDAILVGFTKITNETKCWMSLKPDQVHRVLSDYSLNCPSERLTLQAAALWLNADWSHRWQHAERLMVCARLGLLSQTERLELLDDAILQRLTNLKSLWLAYPTVPMESEVRALFKRHADSLAAAAAPRRPHQAVFVFGGWGRKPAAASGGSDSASAAGPQAACQTYNPRADSWTLRVPSNCLPPSNIGQIGCRVYAGCLAVDGVIYVVGGYDGSRALRTVWCYNLRCPEMGWYEGSCMLYNRYYVCCASVGNILYAIGGHTGVERESEGGTERSISRLDTVERMCIRTNVWEQIASLCVVRSDAGAASIGDRVYVAGGFDGQHYHKSAEVYEPCANQWTLISSMGLPRGGVALVTLGNAIYALGGNDNGERQRLIEKYLPESDEWIKAGQLTRAKSNLSAAAIDDKFILAIGGWSDDGERGVQASVDKFCAATGVVVPVADVGFAASATAACTVYGRQLVERYAEHPASSSPWQLYKNSTETAELHGSD